MHNIPPLPDRCIDCGQTFKGKDAYRKEGYYTRDMLGEPVVSLMTEYATFSTYLHAAVERDAKGKGKATYRAYLYRRDMRPALFYKAGNKALVESALADAVNAQIELDRLSGRAVPDKPLATVDYMKEDGR